MKTTTKVSTNVGLGVIILILIAISGVFLTKFVVPEMKVDEKQNLLMRANTISILLKPELIQSLDGNESDLSKESYRELKKYMRALRAANDDIRFVYIMGLNEYDQQFFYVDSEDPASFDYSAPGDLYPDATQKDIINHQLGITYADGPYTDGWGEWFSAYAPVLDGDNNVVGMLGLDIGAERVLLRVSIVKKAIIMLFSLLFYITLLLVLRTQSLIK
ncbi:cache domain-containing protein [Patescibacteria group bacterium]|nr:cache domain-containing protein [Patescibacteria group bacterium]